MARLTINLSAIKANYKALQDVVGSSCEVSAVVKANAYGLGVASVSQALKEAGCKTFFVATLLEALELRMILGEEPLIAMLNGYNDKNADLYLENKITPVLNDIAELEAYKKRGESLPAIIHIDTCMNRLGMDEGDLSQDDLEGLDVKLIMSHFASSEDKDAASNIEQAKKFEGISEKFPNIPKSLCNSSGIYLDKSYHYDLVRPGMALYGLNPTPYQKNPNQTVITLKAEVLQIHEAKKDETAGYNTTYCFKNDARVAVIDIGYADGILRSLSGTAKVYWNGVACPVRGRVSMDLLIVDLCNLSENQSPKAGDMIEVIGENQTVENLARDANTIGYEILTSLSHRYERKYINS